MPGSYTKNGSTPSKVPYSAKRSSLKGNTSILNFFQKSDAPTSQQQRITQFATRSSERNSVNTKTGGRNPDARTRGRGENSGIGSGSLFLEDSNTAEAEGDPGPETGFVDDDDMEENEIEVLEQGERFFLKFNENGAPVGKRRPGSSAYILDGNRDVEPERPWTPDLDEDEFMSRFDENGAPMKRRKFNSSRHGEPAAHTKAQSRRSGPFIDESDSEGEDLSSFREVEDDGFFAPREDNSTTADAHERRSAVDVPPLVREVTSNVEDDEYAGFDDAENEFREEEFLEPLVDEERQLDTGDESNNVLDNIEEECDGLDVCPICHRNLVGSTEGEISVHVNNCLDGATGSMVSEEDSPTEKGMLVSERAAVPRPAQRDPFAVGGPRKTSAFSKLMAGNAEDTAWAAAAASEVASRGKQAYQRTCPFYKIIPGFSICVDAFRYGAVGGCNAYFLSHFHSDHYIGLTSNWRHGPIYCSKITGNLVRQQLKVDPKWIVDLEFEKTTEVPNTEGVKVTLMEANHCPGSALFLFEKSTSSEPLSKLRRVLHCGDFRACPAHTQHALLRPETFDPVTGQRRYQKIDVCYLDTTYLSPKYSFPSQDDVMQACVDLCVRLNQDDGAGEAPWEWGRNGKAGDVMGKFVSTVPGIDRSKNGPTRQGRLLVVIGTYSIGKERICLAIARALQCKIYATAAKQRVCECLEDAELSSLLTDDPLDAQIHMQTMFEIRAETLADYLHSMKPSFSRIVGFRPTGWTYRPPAGRADTNPSVSTVLHSAQWQTGFSARDLTPQRGSTRECACFGVPYSEHSSFRELTMFCCALRIGRIIPTVNVGSAKSRERMKGWIERWEGERRKHGEYRWAG